MSLARHKPQAKNRKIPLLHLPRRGGEKKGGLAFHRTIKRLSEICAVGENFET